MMALSKNAEIELLGLFKNSLQEMPPEPNCLHSLVGTTYTDRGVVLKQASTPLPRAQRMGFSSVSSLAKFILQRQQAHGAHVHVHAVAKVGVDDKELGDLAPVEEIQKLRRDLSRAAEPWVSLFVAEAFSTGTPWPEKKCCPLPPTTKRRLSGCF